MLFYSSNSDDTLFFEDKNLGIIIYNKIDKKATLFEYSNDKFVYKSSLIEILSIDNIDKKDIFREFYLKTKHDFLKSRYETPLNKIFNMYCGLNNNDIEHFATDPRYLFFCGVDKVQEISIKITKQFFSEEDINFEKDNYESDSNYFYGFWDIKEDKISSSFLFPHIIQTQMCFGDFGKGFLKEGSLFLKLEIIERKDYV